MFYLRPEFYLVYGGPTVYTPEA